MKKKGLIITVIAVVVIAMALVFIALFSFMKGNDNTEETTVTTTETTTVSTTVTTTEITTTEEVSVVAETTVNEDGTWGVELEDWEKDVINPEETTAPVTERDPEETTVTSEWAPGVIIDNNGVTPSGNGSLVTIPPSVGSTPQDEVDEINDGASEPRDPNLHINW